MLCFGILVMVCQQPAPPPATAGATFCDVAAPIYWSKNDTRKTKEAVDTHNRIGRELCGWGKPAPTSP